MQKGFELAIEHLNNGSRITEAVRAPDTRQHRRKC
jgi:hypothetical protein